MQNIIIYKLSEMQANYHLICINLRQAARYFVQLQHYLARQLKKKKIIFFECQIIFVRFQWLDLVFVYQK